MADENEATAGGEAAGDEPCKCPECPPGLPGWMATFSDLVTLLLTFFVLLLSFAKTESAKYEAALGSIRNAFGGNVLQKGEVIQLGKSTDNQPSMVESQAPVRPFPIEFLTMEGMLNKHEINRESTEVLNTMKQQLQDVGLDENVTIYEQKEGIKVDVKDKLYFKDGTSELTEISVMVFDRLVKLMGTGQWNLFIKGHSAINEKNKETKGGPYELSAFRATAVARSLIDKGVPANKITIVSYGDTRPVKVPGKSLKENKKLSRRVEFTVRKIDLETKGHKVDSK